MTTTHVSAAVALARPTDETRAARAELIKRAYLNDGMSGCLRTMVQALEIDRQQLPRDEDAQKEREVKARILGGLLHEQRLLAAIEAAAPLIEGMTGSRYRGWEYAEDLVRNATMPWPETSAQLRPRLRDRLLRLRQVWALEVSDAQAWQIAGEVALAWGHG